MTGQYADEKKTAIDFKTKRNNRNRNDRYDEIKDRCCCHVHIQRRKIPARTIGFHSRTDLSYT